MALDASTSMSGTRIDWRAASIWLGGAIVVASFYALEQQFGCLLFQRGGAALVIYAILVSIASMRARAEYGDELNQIQLEQCEIAQLMYAEDHAPRPEAQNAHRRKIEQKLKALDKRLAHLASAGQRFQDLRFVEGPLLIIGTLIWGFGDMLALAPGCSLSL